VVLDVLMPEMDGTDACRELRRRSDVPIVFLSSKDEEVDRVIGLELGGDDYVTKPFSPRELVARVKAVLRRTEPRAGAAEPSAPIERGPLRLDGVRFEATWDGRSLTLTVTEFALLQALARHPGRVFRRSELMERAYDEPTVVTERTIDSHVRRLRRKLAAVGADPVETVVGVGYRFREHPA
jgi:two-component system OmpR family response regulator